MIFIMTLAMYLFVLHFIADFLLQSREMGVKKSQHIAWFAAHIGIHMLVFFVGMLLYVAFLTPDTLIAYPSIIVVLLKFAVINGIFHAAVDLQTWNLLYKLSIHLRTKHCKKHHPLYYTEDGSDKWKYWEDYWFFVAIGIDQLLHAVTILYVYRELLFK